jgi:crotonobetaine/carnitine-CoA ligase
MPRPELQFEEKPAKKQTLDEILENRAQTFGDKTAVFYGPEDREVSYNELDETANRIGNSLRDIGIAHQAKISLMVRHPLQTLFAFFGIQKSGAIYSPINYDYRGATLSYQINDTDPSLLIIEDQYVSRLNDVKDDLAELPRVVVIGTEAASEPLDEAFDEISFDQLLQGEPVRPDVTVEWDDIASILYTSGTTGDPKGVVQQHRWVISNYAEFSWKLQSPDDVTHTSLPLYHVGGLYADIMGALIAGAQVVVWDEFSSDQFWDRVDEYGATRAMLLSSMIPWLNNQPRQEDDHRNTLNKVTMVPLPENHLDIAERFGFDLVISAYGSTEIGSVLAGIVRAAPGGTPDDLQRGMAPETVISKAKEYGVPVIDEAPGKGWIGGSDWKPSVELAVVNDRDEFVDPGEVGELVGRPTQPGILFHEYDGKPEKTVEAWRNLWFHTGDAMYRDEAGNYYFVDRIGTVIRRRGENISSGQVQDIVNTHPDVDVSAAFPVPAEEGGEDEVGIAVELAEEATLSTGPLRAYLEGEMPEFMIPKYIDIVEAIPTTETNKMEKYKLREDVIQREGIEEQ